MSYRPLLLSFLLFLTSCGYVIEKSVQDVTLLTPGAQDAFCHVYVDGLRYKFHPPQTITIKKSGADLEIDCLAPGNRRKQIKVASDISPVSVAGGPGMAWDYMSGALFQYPEVIEVDFTEIPVTQQPLPAQNNPDIKQPEEYDLEEFSPGEPRLNSDRYKEAIPLQRRDFSYIDEPSYSGSPRQSSHVDDGKIKGKGDLMSVIKNLEDDAGPDAPAEESYGPQQLYPVE